MQSAAALTDDVAHRVAEVGQVEARQPVHEHGSEQRDEGKQRDDERGGHERGDETVLRLAHALDEVRDDEDQDVEQHRADEDGKHEVELGAAPGGDEAEQQSHRDPAADE